MKSEDSLKDIKSKEHNVVLDKPNNVLDTDVVWGDENLRKLNRRIFSHPFSFKGRIRRTEFGISMIIYVVTAMLVGFISDGLSMNGVSEFFLHDPNL